MMDINDDWITGKKYLGSSLYPVDNFKLSQDEIKCQDQEIGSEITIPYRTDDKIASGKIFAPIIIHSERRETG